MKRTQTAWVRPFAFLLFFASLLAIFSSVKDRCSIPTPIADLSKQLQYSIEPSDATIPTKTSTLSDASSTAAPSPNRCGSTGWQDRYTALHNDILAGRAPQKYIVAQGRGGLTNSLYGSITLFYVALLTNRAFIMDTHPKIQSKYEWAYDQPNINWTRLDTIAVADAGSSPNQPPSTASPPPTFKRIELFSNDDQHQLNNNTASQELIDYIYNKDLYEYHPDVDVLFVWTNAGKTVKLFDNPFHRKQLEAMGLRPETAFKCAVEYLLKAKGEVMELVRDELAVITGDGSRSSSEEQLPQQLQQQRPLSISIHIRAGDEVFFNRNGSYEGDDTYKQAYHHLFDCALEIERRYAVAPPRPATNNTVNYAKPVWYFVSDSAFIRQYVFKTYGNTNDTRTVLTQTDSVIAHVTHNFAFRESAEQGKLGFQTAVAEFHTLTQTDFHIGMQKSGYWRAAAVLADKWGSVFSLPTSAKEFKGCGADQAVGVIELSKLPPGI